MTRLLSALLLVGVMAGCGRIWDAMNKTRYERTMIDDIYANVPWVGLLVVIGIIVVVIGVLREDGKL